MALFWNMSVFNSICQCLGTKSCALLHCVPLTCSNCFWFIYNCRKYRHNIGIFKEAYHRADNRKKDDGRLFALERIYSMNGHLPQIDLSQLPPQNSLLCFINWKNHNVTHSHPPKIHHFLNCCHYCLSFCKTWKPIILANIFLLLYFGNVVA